MSDAASPPLPAVAADPALLHHGGWAGALVDGLLFVAVRFPGDKVVDGTRA